MADDPRLEKIFSLIRELVADQRQRLIDDMTADELLAALQAKLPGSAGRQRVTRHPEAEKRERAPAGSARVLCKRALSQAGHAGLTIKKIHDHATGEYETKLSTSAIRNELGVGADLQPPIYKQIGGVWYLTEYAPTTMKIVG